MISLHTVEYRIEKTFFMQYDKESLCYRKNKKLEIKKMILRLPDYYKDFHCIADKCKDSCCIGWEIDIDEETLEYYQEVPGSFGKRLSENIVNDGEDTSFALHNGRCAFLNDKNLCDICTELGETALCEICLEYPRFTVEYGTVREKCLGLSCEEAGRLIFEKDDSMQIEETVIKEQFEWKDEEEYEEYESDGEEMDNPQCPFLEKARNHAIMILQSRNYEIEARAKFCLQFAEAVQAKMNQGEFEGIEEVIRLYPLEKIECMQKCYDTSVRFQLYKQRMEVYETLELLDEEWDNTVKKMNALFTDTKMYEDLAKALEVNYERKEIEYEHLLVYFVFRYGMKAVYDCDFLEKMKFALISFLVIRDMDAACFNRCGHFNLEQRIDMSRIYSKEVEHSEDNLRILSEACMFEEAFSTKSILLCL